MSKSITNQRLVYKIHSSRLKYNNWNLELSFDEAVRNEEIVSLGDSIALRMIRKIQNNKTTEQEINELKNEIKKKKKNKEDFSAEKNKLNNNILEENILLIVFDNDEDWQYATSNNENEFVKFNNKEFKRLVGTNGGIKNNTVVFVNKEFHSEMNKRLNNGRKKSEKYVPAKFEAYKALAFSSSTPVTQPKVNEVLIVEDAHSSFIENVLRLKSKPSIEHKYKDKDGNEQIRRIKSNEFDLVPDEEYKVEKDFTDGCGIILPSLAEQWTIDMGEYKLDENENKVTNYISSGFNIRNAWTKGMVFTFPFDEYADEIGETEVLDVWGDKHKVKDIKLIITTNMLKLQKAYKSIEDYMNKCKINGFEYCVAKVLPEQLEETRNMNYQFLQSYDLEDGEIEELIEPTINDIYGALGENGQDYDYGKMLLFLKGNKINEKDFINEEQKYIKALMINKEMMNDPFIKQKIHKMIKKRIEDSKKGVIKIKGNYGIISGDLYGLCQWIFKKEVTGALKKDEFYNQTWLSKGVNKIVAYRAPMTIHNNIRILNLVNNKITKNYFRYMKVVTIFNAWDTTCDALNGADFDGDAIISTNNPILLRNTKMLPTVICEQNTCKKQIITEKSLIKANKNGFGNEVGAITNRCTAMFDVLAKFEKDTPQYEEMLYRITCMQGYQQEIIDSCKGILPKRVPKEWYSYKAVKVREEDDEGMKIVKEYQKSLLANKKPYFFIYNYKYLKNEFNNYNKNAENNCIIKFGITLDELKNKLIKTEEEQDFLYYYEKLSPVSNNNSIVNRIAHQLEEKLDKLPKNIRKSNFDKNILMTDKKAKKKIKDDLLELYKEYNNSIKETMKSNVNKQKDSVDDVKNNRQLYMKDFIERAKEICKNDNEILCNALIELLYDNSNSKQFLWDICGDYIIEKLLKENYYTISFPVKNINGDILWDGENYSMKSIKIKEEKIC